jgi:hypothetical protein
MGKFKDLMIDDNELDWSVPIFDWSDEMIHSLPVEGSGYYLFNFPDGISVDTTQRCSHNMVDYIGFTQKYKYCTKCNYQENI